MASRTTLQQKIPEDGIILFNYYDCQHKKVISCDNQQLLVNYEFLHTLCPQIMNILIEENGIFKLTKRIPIDGLRVLLKYLGYSKLDINDNNVMNVLIASFVLNVNIVVEECTNHILSNVRQEYVKPYLNYLEITTNIYQIIDCMEDYLSLYGSNELSGNISPIIFSYLIQIDYLVVKDKDFINRKILEYYDYHSDRINDVCSFYKYVSYTEYEKELKLKGIWNEVYNNVSNMNIIIPRIVYQPYYNSIDKILINMCGTENKDKYHLSKEDFNILSKDSSTHNNIVSLLKLDKEHVDDKIYLLALSFSIELKLKVINNIEVVVFDRLKYVYNNKPNNICMNHLYFCFTLFLQNSYCDEMVNVLGDNVIMIFQYPEVIQCDAINMLQRIIKPKNIHLLNGLITSFNIMKLYPNYVNLLVNLSKQMY